MPPEKQPRRKPATVAMRKSVKTSLTVDVDLHARWSAAASLRSMSNNAFAAEVLAEALRGLVIIDRRRSSGQVDPSSDVESAGAA